MLVAHETEEDLAYEVRYGDVLVYTVRRGDPGQTPNGLKLEHIWAMRDLSGDLIDWDKYRNDLFERHDVERARPAPGPRR